MSLLWRRPLALLLLIVGLAQMAGDLASWPTLKGMAAATQLSPAPKVFSSSRGLETFSTQFFLEWTDADGKVQSLEVDSDLYAQIPGPYQRRNVYGAALAYGPVLAADEVGRGLLEPVLAFALGGEAPLLRAMGVDPSTVRGPVRVRYQPREGAVWDDELPRTLISPAAPGVRPSS